MEYVITFPNTNCAIVAERSLLSAGLPISVMPAPVSISRSCGISLRITEDSLQKALFILSDNNIDFSTIYTRIRKAGGFEYTQIN